MGDAEADDCPEFAAIQPPLDGRDQGDDESELGAVIERLLLGVTQVAHDRRGADLALVKCCPRERGIGVKRKTAVVPWGASLDEIRQALRLLTGVDVPSDVHAQPGFGNEASGSPGRTPQINYSVPRPRGGQPTGNAHVTAGVRTDSAGRSSHLQ